MKDLDQLVAGMDDSQPEVALPSFEEQQAIVKKLKALEEAGELTPDILAEHFEKYNDVKEPSAEEIAAIQGSMVNT